MIKGVPEERRDARWHARHLKRLHRRDGKVYEPYMPNPKVSMPKNVIFTDARKVEKKEPWYKKFNPFGNKYA